MNFNGIQLVADGEEHTTRAKSATITGTVMMRTPGVYRALRSDAGAQNTGGDQIYWQTYNIIKGVEGAFPKLTSGNTALQIEADDHLPAIVSFGNQWRNALRHRTQKGGAGDRSHPGRPAGRGSATRC